MWAKPIPQKCRATPKAAFFEMSSRQRFLARLFWKEWVDEWRTTKLWRNSWVGLLRIGLVHKNLMVFQSSSDFFGAEFLRQCNLLDYPPISNGPCYLFPICFKQPSSTCWTFSHQRHFISGSGMCWRISRQKRKVGGIWLDGKWRYGAPGERNGHSRVKKEVDVGGPKLLKNRLLFCFFLKFQFFLLWFFFPPQEFEGGSVWRWNLRQKTSHIILSLFS